jgi:hypothetical protein
MFWPKRNIGTFIYTKALSLHSSTTPSHVVTPAYSPQVVSRTNSQFSNLISIRDFASLYYLSNLSKRNFILSICQS